MPDINIIFYLLMFGAAFLYASVGHGGASGYLAVMSLYHFAPQQMKPIALCINLFVSMIAFVQFYRAGYFRWPLFWPLAIASIPMAFLGGSIHVPLSTYKVLLGVVLLLIVFRFLIMKNIPGDVKQRPVSIPILLLTGGTIGFLSGLIGIGGGVLLSPIILVLAWANQKQAASISAIFIFVNSAAGLVGQLVVQKTPFDWGTQMFTLIGLGIAGSLLGAYLGAKKLGFRWLKYLLSAVLLIAAIKLIIP